MVGRSVLIAELGQQPGEILRYHLEEQKKKKKKDPSGMIHRIKARHVAAKGDEKKALAIVLEIYPAVHVGGTHSSDSASNASSSQLR
jgi:hypothetical protein